MNSLHTNITTILSIIFSIFLGLLLASCNDSAAVISEPKVVDPAPPIPPGAEVSVSVDVTSPKPVTYQWRTDEDGGQILQGETSSAAIWQAPQQEGTYNVRVAVTIDNQVTEKSVAIKVGEVTVADTLAAQADGQLVAIITILKPKVEVKRAGTATLIPATFGMPLYQGDVVNTYVDATVEIICESGEVYQLEAERNLTVNCQEMAGAQQIDQLDPSVSEEAVRASGGATPDLAAETDRSSRAEQAEVPLLLTPRNSLITDPRPTFQWQPVAEASGYRITLDLVSGETWHQETTDTSLPYPADAPPLVPGGANFVTLTTLDDETATDTSLLFVLDEAGLTNLAEAEAAIQASALDETAQAYLLAQLYRQRDMRAAAIAQLEQLTGAGGIPSAYLAQQLGDLYFEAGLYALAEESYQLALTAAEASADKSAQAAAYVGLARAAHVFKETEQARDYLTTAENLYREAGETERAELIAAERAKLEE